MVMNFVSLNSSTVFFSYFLLIFCLVLDDKLSWLPVGFLKYIMHCSCFMLYHFNYKTIVHLFHQPTMTDTTFSHTKQPYSMTVLRTMQHKLSCAETYPGLNCRINVFQTLHHQRLMLHSVTSINLNNPCKYLDTCPGKRNIVIVITLSLLRLIWFNWPILQSYSGPIKVNKWTCRRLLEQNIYRADALPAAKPAMSTRFLLICQNQIQGLFKDFQGPYEGYIRRTKLNQPGTFISIYKHHKLPQQGPGLLDFMHIWGQKEAIWYTFFNINWFGHGVLENQIQALSRTFRHRFKDFQGPCLFSRTFQALKI